MAKVVIVNNCGECPECGFNENHLTENWDEHYCIVTGKNINLETMPDDCPLPDNTIEDLQSKLSRLQEELRKYKFTDNSPHWHGKYGE